MEDRILIRYGELSLKKTNRRQFVTKITNNIKRALKDYSELTFESRGMRFYIILHGVNAQMVIDILKKIPGIHSFSVASRCESEIEAIKKLAFEIINREVFSGKSFTFKVETNRADKSFPINSLDITKNVSNYLFKNIPNLKADVHNPDFVLDIDVRLEGTFIYTNKISGLGGLPAGCLGKSLLMVSGGIDSIVAGWMAIKKGVTIEAIHFASPPYTGDLAVQKVIDLLEVLASYTEYQNINLYIVPFTKIQKAIYENCRDDYGVTIMRRMMYRISEIFANNLGANAIINGENVGQVASQTLESIKSIECVTQIPIIRPLAMFDKEDIMKIAVKINTFNISIRPYEDCCTIFVPKHPQIKPHQEIAEKQELKFDYQTLIKEAIENIEKITIRGNSHYNYLNRGSENLF